MPKSLSNNTVDYWMSQTLCNVSDHAKILWPDAGHSSDCEQAEREHSQSARSEVQDIRICRVTAKLNVCTCLINLHATI